MLKSSCLISSGKGIKSWMSFNLGLVELFNTEILANERRTLLFLYTLGDTGLIQAKFAAGLCWVKKQGQYVKF